MRLAVPSPRFTAKKNQKTDLSKHKHKPPRAWRCRKPAPPFSTRRWKCLLDSNLPSDKSRTALCNSVHDCLCIGHRELPKCVCVYVFCRRVFSCLVFRMRCFIVERVCVCMCFFVECLVVWLVECVVSWCNVCVCVCVFCRRVFGCFVVRMRCFMV